MVRQPTKDFDRQQVNINEMSWNRVDMRQSMRA